MNKVILVGNVTKDPVFLQTASGTERVTFSLATADLRDYSTTYFFQCVGWNNVARFVNNYIVKGQAVCIDGRLTSRSYIDPVNQQKKYITEVVIDNINAIGSLKKNQTSDNDFNVIGMYSKKEEQDNFSQESLNNEHHLENDQDEIDDFNDDLEDWGNDI